MKSIEYNHNLREFLKKINSIVTVEKSIELYNYTTFKTGGNADYFIAPKTIKELTIIKKIAYDLEITLFILGKGANILISDNGVRNPVLYTGNLKSIKLDSNEIYVESGCSIEELCDFSLTNSLSGLEFISGLPSSVGGAIWMNARCYGNSISQILHSVDYIDSYGNKKTLFPKDGDFEYKKSPFQSNEWIIVSAIFKLKKGLKKEIQNLMQINKDDREKKGHFRYPCAGSIFKNNRSFGKPSGEIIDSLGLRGTTIGGACISDFHANIIINNNNASSSDIRKLIIFTKQCVFDKLGYKLEEEVLYIGDWEVAI